MCCYVAGPPRVLGWQGLLRVGEQPGVFARSRAVVRAISNT